MRALSIRQPYAELIMRGIKRIEFRSRPTSIIGERFYIYASQQWAVGKLYLAGCEKPEIRNPNIGSTSSPQAESMTNDEARMTNWSTDLSMPGSGPEPWMMELAKMLILKDLPMGVIVGSAVISECRSQALEVRDQKSEVRNPDLLTSDLRPLTSGLYEWHLADVQRVKKLRKPKGRPQPVWFNPFD
jgi:predicted transcriptional regulator